ncbi:MAG TPA: hypothetical protein PK467_02515 [Candidatus Wallbacteria bacterium]|nr:hypothetical protein [Candidatus Wallbacteria bacterium]
MKGNIIRTLVISEKQNEIDNISKLLQDSSIAAFKILSINAIEDHIKCSFSLAHKKVIFKLMSAGCDDKIEGRIRPEKVDLIIYSMKSYFINCYLNAMKLKEIFRRPPLIAIVEPGLISLRLTSLEYVVDGCLLKPDFSLKALEQIIFSTINEQKNKKEEKTSFLKYFYQPERGALLHDI